MQVDCSQVLAYLDGCRDEMLRLCQLAVGYMRDYHQLQHETEKGE